MKKRDNDNKIKADSTKKNAYNLNFLLINYVQISKKERKRN